MVSMILVLKKINNLAMINFLGKNRAFLDIVEIVNAVLFNLPSAINVLHASIEYFELSVCSLTKRLITCPELSPKYMERLKTIQLFILFFLKKKRRKKQS